LYDNFARALNPFTNRTADIIGIEDALNDALEVIESPEIGSLLPKEIGGEDSWYFFEDG
jgi:hypothetical protein